MLKKPKFILTIIIFTALFLRFFQLGNNPPSPYWEEAAIGYDAYSILKTDKDFHGNSWPLIAFESFGDYKPSLYFYATVPAIALFGLNILAVRFPSAFFGTLTIFLVYLLTQALFPKKKSLSLITAFLLAISPWHLQLSRVGFEANLGLFLVVLGSWLFLKGIKKPKWLILAAATWALSMYAYHANRVFIPLLGLAFGLTYFKKLSQKKSATIIAVITFLLIIWPLVLRLNTIEVKQRFQQTSAFTTLDPIIKSNQLIEQDGSNVVAKIFHHRLFQYQSIFIDHYLDNFNFNFLFLSGDTNPRHSIQLVGSLYLIQLPLLIWGLIRLIKNKHPSLLLLFLWLLLSPIPAALTKATPHALRSLPMIIPLTIISAYGLINLPYLKRLLPIFSFILIFELLRYQFIYYHDSPRLYSSHWQYGYQQMIDFVSDRQADYQQIYITRELGRPSIYYWFYTQTNPQLVQAVSNKVKKDQGEYLEFDKLIFDKAPANPPPSSLIVAGQKDKIPASGLLLKEIKDLSGQTVFKIYEI